VAGTKRPVRAPRIGARLRECDDARLDLHGRRVAFARTPGLYQLRFNRGNDNSCQANVALICVK
jgi:hypothetical protein